MNPSQIYVLIAIVALAIVALVVFVLRKHKGRTKPTWLAEIAFMFVIAGIVLGENRLVGYGLMGIGVILALIDTVKREIKNR